MAHLRQIGAHLSATITHRRALLARASNTHSAPVPRGSQAIMSAVGVAALLQPVPAVRVSDYLRAGRSRVGQSIAARCAGPAALMS